MYTGILIDGNTKFVTLSINTNSMWDVKPASGSWPAPGVGSTGSSGHVPTAYRCALGGVTFWAPSANFGATQRIADATLTTTQSTAANEALTTSTVLHPQLQVTSSTLTWNGSAPLKLHVSTWAAAALHYGHTRDTLISSAACCESNGKPAPCTSTGALHCVARNASNDPSPKQIWVGLSTRIVSRVGGVSTTALNVSNNAVGMWGGTGQLVSAVTTIVTLLRGQTFTTVTALADSFFSTMVNSSANQLGRSPLPDAAALATTTTPTAIMSASDASWAEFWKTSSVSTPTLPALEWCWYGSLYWTKSFASTDPSVPPSGLYGPWVSSDKPAWNGDLTLDVSACNSDDQNWLPPTVSTH